MFEVDPIAGVQSPVRLIYGEACVKPMSVCILASGTAHIMLARGGAKEKVVKPTYRRALAMVATLLVLFVYAFFAASVGALFADKPPLVQMTYFAIAGMAWVIPLYPVYKWMRGLSPEEAAAEKPPAAADVRKH
jgi:hypothetical protein